MRIAGVNLSLQRCGDENVAVVRQNGRTVLNVSAALVAGYASMLTQVLRDFFDVQTCFIDNGTVVLDDRDDADPIFFGQELGGVVADVAKPLNDHRLPSSPPSRPASATSSG